MDMNRSIYFGIFSLAGMFCCSASFGQSIGDKVEFERLGRKFQGEIKEVRVEGKIFSINYQNGARAETITLPISRFRVLGGSSGSKTTNPPSTGSGASGGGNVPAVMRMWTDTTGNFKVKAKFTERVDNLIRLETEDGRLITVPIEKLSPFDKKYLETAKASMEVNPFAGGEKIDKSQSGSAGNAAQNNSGIAMNTVTPNIQAGKKLILISSGDWNVTPDAEVTSNANPQPVEHGPGGFEKPFFDKMGGFIISPDEKVAAVSITNAFGGNRTGIQFFDLEAGKQLSSVGVPIKEASLVGVIMDPPTFATTRKEWFKDKGRVDFWDGSDGLKHVIGWEGKYKSAKLLNNQQLLTIDDKGQAVVWDWKSAKAQFYFQAHAHATPAISANAKQIAVAVSTGIMIIDLESGKPLGTLSTNERVSMISFSRDGTKIASIQNGNLAIWDLTDGSLVDEFAVVGISPFNPSLNWVDDENILVNGSAVVNYRLRVPIWNYKVKNGSMPLSGGKGGRFWYSVKGSDGKGTIIPIKIPHQEVLDVASNYDPEDFLVIKPGMKISIRMNLPFGQPDQQKIYESLAAKLEANGCIVDSTSPIVLNCFTEKGKTQTREYQDRGGFGRPFGGGTQKVTFTPTICYMQIAKGSDVLWKRSVSSGPGFMMFLNEGESVQQAANNQSKPSPNFYTGAQIPKLYARLPAGKKALGESELTENGLR